MEAFEDDESMEYSSPEEVKEYHDIFEKFRDIYLKVSSLITKGTELETRNEREVSFETGNVKVIHSAKFNFK
jgi:post-segregation antitoxin (ccd killing protein)